jgi:PAS domain S-box-containing protein
MAAATTLLQAAPVAVIALDGAKRVRFWNAAATDLLGWGELEVRGMPLPTIREGDREEFQALAQTVLEGSVIKDVGVSWLKKDGTPLEASLSAAPLPETGLVLALADVSACRRAERTLSASDARFRFLAEVSHALASSLDAETTLNQIARLAIPHFADCCVVYRLDESGSAGQLAVAHRDLAHEELLREVHRRYPLDPDFPRGYRRVLRTGEPDLLEEVTEEFVTAAATDADHLALLRQLGLRSNLSVPLIARGRVLGAMTFGTAVSGRHYGPADLALAQDIARRAALAMDNARLFQSLQEADRRKDEFLALLGHELRNPLSPIWTGLHILRLHLKDHPQVESVAALIERQVRHLTRLVDDLLDISRITRGKVELRLQPVEVGALVARAVETARPFITQCEHQLSVEVSAEPVFVKGDPTRLEQILVNLLNNAAKYTGPGGRITLTAGREGRQVVFRVQDTGIGIREEMLGRIFDPFTQADRLPGRAQEGLGIGLTLVRRLVEMHGGSVAVWSAGPGKGSEFLVRLPLGNGPA